MKNSDFYDLIRDRRSIRAFDPKRKVPKETLINILEAGRLAPTASNRQPLKFHILGEGKVLDELRGCYSKSWFHNSGCKNNR